jgi:hypothetical protein
MTARRCTEPSSLAPGETVARSTGPRHGLPVALRDCQIPQLPQGTVDSTGQDAHGNRVSRCYFLYLNYSHSMTTDPRPALCTVGRRRRVWKHQKGTKNIQALQPQGLRRARVTLAGGRSTWDE